MRMRRSLRYFVLGLAGALLLGFCHGVPASAQSDATPALSEDELARVTAALGLLQSGRTDDTFLESVRALSPLTQGEVMFEAAGRGYDEAVTGMIDAGVPVNARGIAGWTPLMAAIFAGNDDLAITLIDRGADPNATAPDGISVASLAEAASSRSLLWKLALARGDTSDGSLLGIAARTGDLAALNEAVGAGADVNAVDEKGRTPLLNAAQGGYYEAVSYLIDRSANVNKAAPDGATPLAIAVLAKNEDLVRQFLVAKADPNAKLSGIPVISVALSLGSDIIAKALLDAGADPAAKDDNGLVPLDYAKFGELETMDPRIEAAALRPRFGQADLLNAIAQRDVVAVRKILDSGVSANTRFPDGKTPIHVALIAEDTSIIRTLLLHNPDLSERTPDGETVLMLAARGKAALIILPMISQELTSSGDPRLITLFQAQDRNGRTAILNAVMNRKINGAHVLPDLYPAVGPSDTVLQTLDNHGLTPLAVAVLNNDADAVQQLLRMGAKLHVTVGGATLQEVARAKKYWKVLSHLPDDRILPRGVAKDMPKAVAQELQKQLKEWGYYNGSIDGALGAGSAAALKAMLKDREFELKEMSAASDEWSVSNFANGNRMIARSDRVEKLTEWYVYEWAERDKLIGFVKIDKEFRDGIVLYTESNGREHLMLFGAHGFNDAKVLARW